MSRFCAVITTINVPTIVAELADNARTNKRDVRVIVIGDKRTPPEAERYLEGLGECGITLDYYSPARQEAYLQAYPELTAILPWNTDNRRNLGHLIAWADGDEITLTIDDDNYPAVPDYFGAFDVLGDTGDHTLTSSSNGWYNVCELLEATPDMTFHPRGYPVAQRFEATRITQRQALSRRVVQAGLWNGVPDIDASTHVTAELATKGTPGRNALLDRGTWCPFNTQNSAFLTEMTPAFYYVSMAAKLGHAPVDRYGDIWASYLARKAIDAVEQVDGTFDVVGFGDPLANHIRNQHDALRDLTLEAPAMALNPKLLDVLAGIELTPVDSYQRAADELAELLPAAIQRAPLDREQRDYLLQLAEKYAIWTRVCRRARNSGGAA
ncbi:MAG: hypothetical protein AAF515_14665 [Pseudomonadota bacterium]